MGQFDGLLRQVLPLRAARALREQRPPRHVERARGDHLIPQTILPGMVGGGIEVDD